MSTTLIKTRILKKVFEDDVPLNIGTSTTRRQLVGLAKSTVLSSFENLALISPSPSHEQDLVSAAVNTRLTFEQVTDAATNNMSASLSHFEQQLEALKSESTMTKKQLAKQEAAIQLLKDDNRLLKDDNAHLKTSIQSLTNNNAHLKTSIQSLTNDNTRLKADIQKLNDRIRPLARIALRVFLDAFFAVKGYNPDTSGSRKTWISDNIKDLVPNTGISQTRFEYLLNVYRDIADVNAHTAESLEVALAIEVMDEGKLEFSMLFEECLGHSIEAEINKCVGSTNIDGRNEGRAGQKVVRFVTTRPHAKSRACKVANGNTS